MSMYNKLATDKRLLIHDTKVDSINYEKDTRKTLTFGWY